jgi:hypothetical protein
MWFRRLWLVVAWLTAWGVAEVQAAEFEVEKTDRGVTVRLDGELFTEYLVESGGKPILWPLIGPTGKPVTRAHPMAKVPGEHTDHVHHRSLWFTHGDVNGVDFWLEGSKAGKIIHRQFVAVEGGSHPRIVTINDWVGPQGNKICEDLRRFEFAVEDDGARIIDVDLTVTASNGKVVFGDTKEGSFAVRVAEPIRVDAKQGGRIVNSQGDVDGAAWGKRAAWVDYHGPVDGQRVGIAILNHPSSTRYPTHWHVRTYGLFAANPFGIHDFEKKPAGAGNLTLQPGETLVLRYRVVLHRGDEKEGKIAERFKRYAGGNDEQP